MDFNANCAYLVRFQCAGTSSDDMDPEELDAMFEQWAEEGFACRPYKADGSDTVLYTYGSHKN